MGSPDRDVVGYSRLFRYHIVGCSHPSPLNIPLNESGMILDTTGTTASDITYVPGYKTAAMGTVDLDAEWVNRQHIPYVLWTRLSVWRSSLKQSVVFDLYRYIQMDLAR